MSEAAEVVSSARALLLDFDGPITGLMPPPLNAQAAEQARLALQEIPLPDEIATTTDHLAVLHFAAAHRPDRYNSVERACSEAEIDCARRSQPSPEAQALFEDAQRRSVPVAVVSNNSAYAVREFLHRFSWAAAGRVFACRTPEVGARLKPDPFLVQRAIALLRVHSDDCIFVGDSVSDVQAGNAAGVRVVGLAKTPERGRQLLAAGAVALIERAA